MQEEARRWQAAAAPSSQIAPSSSSSSSSSASAFAKLNAAAVRESPASPAPHASACSASAADDYLTKVILTSQSHAAVSASDDGSNGNNELKRKASHFDYAVATITAAKYAAQPSATADTVIEQFTQGAAETESYVFSQNQTASAPVAGRAEYASTVKLEPTGSE